MGSCLAYGCTNTFSKKIPGITFHAFPKNEERKALWVQAVRRENWEPTKASRLCSAHFNEDVIDRTSLAVVRLRENAVPTIFESFPMHLQKTKKCRKSPANRTRDVTFPDHGDDSNTMQPVLCSPNSVIEPVSPDKFFYKRKVDDLLNVVDSKNKKIKVLQQQVRRCRRKLENLSALFKDLEEKRYMNDDSLEILKTVSKVNEEFLSRQLSSVTDKLPCVQKELSIFN